MGLPCLFAGLIPGLLIENVLVMVPCMNPVLTLSPTLAAICHFVAHFTTQKLGMQMGGNDASLVTPELVQTFPQAMVTHPSVEQSCALN